MNWIAGPNRAFGKGEQKQQNAVIKVYSAAEFKNALTQLYTLPSVIGTIEIAGDIVITEPIKLKLFAEEDDDQPLEIIIQAVAGARIINGNKEYGTSYTYDASVNKNIPVFDYGILPTTVPTFPQCKYTFKDLTINTENAKPFGALIAGNIAGNDSFLPRISLYNIKAANLWNIFAAYDSTTTLSANVARAYGVVINDFKFSNYDTTITETSLNSQYFGCQNSNISNIALWDLRKFFDSNNKIKINNISAFQSNYIASVTCNTEISGTDGEWNLILSSQVDENAGFVPGFSYIQCNPFLSANNVNIFDTDLEKSAFSIVGDDGNNNVATSTTHVIKKSSGFIRGIATLIANTYYEVDWKLTVKYVATGLVNAYHFKTSIRVDGTGVGTVISNSTLFAAEEVFTLSGLVPTILGSELYIEPTDPPNTLDCSCTITIDGFKQPNF